MEKVFKITVSEQEYNILRIQAAREDISTRELVNNLVLGGIQQIAEDFRNHSTRHNNAMKVILERPTIDPTLPRPITPPDDISGLGGNL